MSIINNYYKPVVHNWNYDEEGKLTSLLRENEAKPVIGGKIILEEIPDPYRRVYIEGYVEIDFKKAIIDTFHYKVDYTQGVVFFHDSKEGQIVNITRYYGRGMFYTPASRIWTQIDDYGNVIHTLEDALNVVDSAELAQANLEQAISNSVVTTTNLNNSVISANNVNSTLIGTIISANDTKDNLDTSIAEGTIIRNDLYNIVSGTDYSNVLAGLDSKADLSYVNNELAEKADIATFPDNVRQTILSGISFLSSSLVTASDTVLIALGKLQKQISDLLSNFTAHIMNTGNPHGVSKEQLYLGNVENKSSAMIRGEISSLNVTSALGYTPLNPSVKGMPNGLAELDENGKVPSAQLPSYVDDVQEYATISEFPAYGISGVIYIDSATNITYRWSGSTYTPIGSDLALGETSATAYRGDRGKIAYDHSQLPHDKAMIGLGNVDNTSDLDKPISTAVQNALDNLEALSPEEKLKLEELQPTEITREEFIATEGQTLFNLTLGNYVTGKNRLSIYITGIKQPTTAYTETSQTSFTLNASVPAGTSVIAEWIEGVTTITESLFTADSIVQTDAKNFVSLLEKSSWNSKAEGIHTHVMADITDLNVSSDVAWVDILNKPIVFPPDIHSHTKSEITDLSLSWNDIMSKPIAFPPDAHTHLQSEITDLSLAWTAITGKPTTFTPSTHNHTKAEISDFPASLPANGGNADTVDGLHASSFAPSGRGLGEALSGTSVSDSNLGTVTGMYYAVSADPNKPSGVTDGALFVMAYNASWINQLYLDWRTNRSYRRNCNGGVWGTWVELIPASGGTMTGILQAQNNTSYTTQQVRNVFLSTADPSGGSNGDIWIKYTP